ncbi:hypothetical protein GCM10011331_18770 [Flavimobilis marinus]|uniref:Uncharacterized protein n=1 Tax=Flavimobilis marinus TaxID=285351 RepID=A0A1I2F2U4_9MICO|nr:hypothetical protein [Flavimobilis marinus]GHG53315.1 hypothetical protein GCM10011331_18770 [Flavimobilis marinus]SFE99293.1 hypothetical protein SAMN04488035_1078 [Flavimobilis marinus]
MTNDLVARTEAGARMRAVGRQGPVATGRRALGALLAVTLLASCANTDAATDDGSPHPSEAARTATLAAASEGVDAVTSHHPGLELDYAPERDNRWHDCSGMDGMVERDGALPPERLQWMSSRSFYPSPARPTAPLIDAVVDTLVSNGWTIGYQSTNDTGRDISLGRDGISLSVGGTTRVVEGRDPSLRLSVSSRCIEAPPNLGYSDATGSDT